MAGAGVSILAQYIIVRKDLKLGVGVIAAQAAHAAVAAVWESRGSDATERYCSPDKIDSMHKIVLGADSLADFERVAASLDAHGIIFRRWLEQPENVVTCIATAPCEQDTVRPAVAGLKLLR